MASEWVDDFLASLTLTPNVSEACRQARVTRKAAYDRRKADPAFAAAWDTALEESTDELVGECYRRAKDGTEKPVFYKGDECGAIREYSDTLAIFLLKAHRREVYGDVSKIHADLTSAGGPLFPAELQRRVAADPHLADLLCEIDARLAAPEPSGLCPPGEPGDVGLSPAPGAPEPEADGGRVGPAEASADLETAEAREERVHVEVFPRVVSRLLSRPPGDPGKL